MIVTDKMRAVAATLPESLRAVFITLVVDYRFAAFSGNRPQNLSLQVVAELVLAGWSRPLSEEEIKHATLGLAATTSVPT